MTAAVLTSDEAALVDGVSFPFRVGTMEEEFIIEDPQDWLSCAARFLQTLQSQGVNHYIRLCTEAEFLSDNYISGHHVTHTMRNANAVVPAYENRATLVRVDGTWRFSEIEVPLRNTRWPISTVYVDGAPPSNTARPAPPPAAEADVRRSSASPKELYQTFINELSAINLADDFEAWCAKCEFPHSVHIEQVDEVIETPDHIRPFLDMLGERIETLQIDQIDRVADHAEFISATRLCGYHTTTFFSKGEAKLGPVLGRYILNRTGTSWRMGSVTNSLSNPEFPYAQPNPGDALVSLREIQERTLKK